MHVDYLIIFIKNEGILLLSFYLPSTIGMSISVNFFRGRAFPFQSGSNAKVLTPQHLPYTAICKVLPFISRDGRNKDEAQRRLFLKTRLLKISQRKRSFFTNSITKMPFPPVTCCQSQIVCSGCRNLLIYPAGATSICCALCYAVSPVPTSGVAMARLVCKGCHTLLMYSRGATSVQCSCCRIVNSASKANQSAHINCGNCRVLLMYQCGAHSVKCTLCNFVTSVGIQRSI